MGYPQLSNNAWGNIASAIGPTDTTIPLTTGQGARFPATSDGNWFYTTLIDATGALEIVRVNNRTGDLLTVVRGQDGTNPRSFSAGAAIELRFVSRIWNVDAFVAFAPRDGARPMTGDLDMATLYTVKNLKAPVADTDAATKKYVDDLVAKAMPLGAIMLWKSATIPAGWQISDGTNGTVDMRDKFVVGAGSGYAVLATGGAAVVTLTEAQMPAHQHGGGTDAAGIHSHGGVTAPAGSHGHSIFMYTDGAGDADGGNNMFMTSSKEPGGLVNPSSYMGANAIGDHQHVIYADGNHAHSIVTDFRGGNAAHENRPPYTALYYIAKTF